MKKVYLAILLFVALPALAQQKSDVEATTAGGQKVILHPDGRWDFVDGPQPAPAKATESKPAAAATTTESTPQSGGVRRARMVAGSEPAAFCLATRITIAGR